LQLMLIFSVLSTGQNFEIAIDMNDYNALRARSFNGELNVLVLCESLARLF